MFLQNIKEKNNEMYFLTPSDHDVYKEIKKNIRNAKWFEAYKLEKKIQDEGFRKAINTYISLNKFVAMEEMNQQEILGLIEFTTENYFLPNFDNFNNRIEFYYLNNAIKYENVNKYFEKFKSKNVDIRIKLLFDEKELVIANGNSNKELVNINDKIKNMWILWNFSKKEQEQFLNTFGNVIGEDSIIRKAELLVFTRKFEELESLVDLIQQQTNYRTLFNNILESEKKKDIGILRDIPKNLKENEALLYQIMRHHRKNGNNENAIDILLNLKSSGKFEKYWWVYRNMYARDFIRDKQYEKAYALTNSYNGAKNIDYTESQWLSGWIALRYMNNTDKGLKHFQNFYKSVSYPASVAKASYWIGKAFEKMGNEKEAIHWYDVSSGYSLTFYGQLAHYAKYSIIVKNGGEYKNFVFPTIPEITEEDKDNLNRNETVKLAFLYYNYEGKRTEANEIFKQLVTKILKKRGEIAELIEIIEALDDEKMIIPLSKLASHRNVIFMNNLFPILRMARKTDENVALIHAIIKQESGFIIQAESNAGAIGFMQIMPTTAKMLCKQLRITYNQYKLGHDPQYNIKLGSFYINQLIKQFRGSKILAVSSYNAGPSATNRWIKNFGDPRETNNMENIIDWMESITYKETRDYVQKIFENLIVYEYRLNI
jgi:soluble lytic murein transglycosylase